jgi:hypothetical protein
MFRKGANKKIGDSGRKRCTYIKGWFNPISPLFLT